MGKTEIIKYLIKIKRPAEIPEMEKQLKINRSNISRSCRGLKKENVIIVKKVKSGSFTKYLISLNPSYLK